MLTLTLEAVHPFAFKESGATRTLKSGERFDLPEEKANKLLRLAEGKVRVVIQEPDTTGAPDPLGNVQQAFTLNTGSSLKTPPIRHTLFEPGQVVEVSSPMLGRFQAEVLKDNGVVCWVWHPFLDRETAVPNEWLVEVKA